MDFNFREWYRLFFARKITSRNITMSGIVSMAEHYHLKAIAPSRLQPSKDRWLRAAQWWRMAAGYAEYTGDDMASCYRATYREIMEQIAMKG